MLIVAIIALALILLTLISKRRAAPPARETAGLPDHRRVGAPADDSVIVGRLPDSGWPRDTSPDDFTPGGGDFGGAGRSASWTASTDGDGD
jgi:hypothetical protein